MERFLIILFGLPGVGKTAAGEMLARDFGFDFVDADDLMTDDIRQRLQYPESEADAEGRQGGHERNCNGDAGHRLGNAVPARCIRTGGP